MKLIAQKNAFAKHCLLVFLLSTIGLNPVWANATSKTLAASNKRYSFNIGFYYPAIVNLVTRADYQVAVNFLVEGLGLKSTQARLFDDITELKQAFDKNELDFIMAPPVLLAKHIDRDKLADGFVGTSANGGIGGTVLLVRKDQHISTLEQLANKKLLLSSNDDLAALYLDTLTLKTFKQHYQNVFSEIKTKDKQTAVVLGLFFKEGEAAMTYKQNYELMAEMNPQLTASLDVLASFPAKSINYGYFHRNFPAPLRRKVTQKISQLNTQPRWQHLLNKLHMSRLIPCPVNELAAFDQLITDHQALQNGIIP